MSEIERADFEAWCKVERYDTRPSCGEPQRYYMWERTEAAWKSWLARAALAKAGAS